MVDNVGLFLAKRALLSPKREAYVDPQGTIRVDYAGLAGRSNRAARALEHLGVAAGDRVALLLRNGSEFVETFFALARIGAVVVPINWRLAADEVAFILEDSGAVALAFASDLGDLASDLAARSWPSGGPRYWISVGKSDESPGFAVAYQDLIAGGDERDPNVGARGDDSLYIMYTSGTTGRPKGAVHTHTSAMWACITIEQTLDLRHGDRYLITTPLFHVAALTPMTTNVHRGATNVVMAAFDPLAAWKAIEQERVTAMLAVPAMLAAMLSVLGELEVDHSALRWIMTGAAPVPSSLVRAYRSIGINVLQVYGLTETCGPACVVGPDDFGGNDESTGKAFFHTTVRVVGDDGAEVEPGAAGEILVAGPHLMNGYWKRPEATQEVLRDGWLRTGDIASIDEAGLITICDRKKDMIISGGENIYPAEIESVLLECPGVADAAVIGQPSDRWGEVPLAVIVPRIPGPSVPEVLDFCRARLAGFKVPTRIEFVEEIPRNPSGKILKRVLRQRFLESAGS